MRPAASQNLWPGASGPCWATGSFEDANGDHELNFPGLWEASKEDGEL